MPRGKSTKSKGCQTDTVYLSEDQVQTIANRSVNDLKTQLEQLQHEMKTSKMVPKEKLDELLNPHLSNLQEQFKTSTKKITNDLDSLNNLQQAAEISIEQLQGQLDELEEKFENETVFHSNRHECEERLQQNQQRLELKVDDLEQQNKLKNLKICGIEEVEGEDVKGRVIDLAKKQMMIGLKPAEIEASRMGASDPLNTKPRDILVKFESHSVRNTIYKKKRMLRNQSNNVYINEHLTTARSHLFYQARLLKKQQKLFGVWTQTGNILIKVNMDSTPKAVSNMEEIKCLIKEVSCNDSELSIESTSFVDATTL